VGVNVVDYAAQSLGWAKAMQLFGASFFGNGANVSAVITKKGKFDPVPLARLKTEVDKIYKGPRNGNKVAYLDDEMDWKAIGVDPEKAQLTDANYFLVEEVCRWFSVPPHKIAHLLRATFSNIEQQNIEVVQDCLMPWAKRLEDEADYKLFGQNRTNLHTKINLRGLLRGDFKSQQEGLQIMRNTGTLSADEWRAFVEMNPMPAGQGGDKYTMQSQYTELKKIGTVAPVQPNPFAPKPEDPAADPAKIASPDGNDDDPDEKDAMSHFSVFAEHPVLANA
jgi:HK97 family phage portal protein